MTKDERVADILDRMFTMGGTGIVADRLELKKKEVDGSERALGGWCRRALEHILAPALAATERRGWKQGMNKAIDMARHAAAGRKPPYGEQEQIIGNALADALEELTYEEPDDEADQAEAGQPEKKKEAL